MLKKLSKAELVSDANITPLILQDDMIQFEFQSLNNPDEKYLVTMNEYNLWRCDCPDFTYRGLEHEEGSYMCKHIIAAILYLHRIHGKQDTLLSNVSEDVDFSLGSETDD